MTKPSAIEYVPSGSGSFRATPTNRCTCEATVDVSQRRLEVAIAAESGDAAPTTTVEHVSRRVRLKGLGRPRACLEQETIRGFSRYGPGTRRRKARSVVRELTHVEADAVAPQAGEQPPAGTGARSGQRTPRRAAVVVGGPLLVTVTAVIVLVTQFQTAYLTNDDTTVASLLYGDYTGKRTLRARRGSRAVRAHRPPRPCRGPRPAVVRHQLVRAADHRVDGDRQHLLHAAPAAAGRRAYRRGGNDLAACAVDDLAGRYTSTALFLGGVGIILFAVSAKVRGRLGVVYAVVGGMFLGTSCSILRANGLLAARRRLRAGIRHHRAQAGLRRCLVFGLVVGVFVIAGWGANRLEYSSPGWRDYMRMNAARWPACLLTHRAWTTRTSPTLTSGASGATRERPLAVPAILTFPDTKVYSTDSIRKLAAVTVGAGNDQVGAGQVFNAFFRYGADEERRADKGVVAAPFTLIAFVSCLWRRRSIAWLTALSLVWFLAVLIAILLFRPAPGSSADPARGSYGRSWRSRSRHTSHTGSTGG